MDLANIESSQDLPDTPIPLPLEVDLRYNVAVCTECYIGVAFDWIQRHLTSQHGIRKQLDTVMDHLNIEVPTLSYPVLIPYIHSIYEILCEGLGVFPP